MIVASVLIWTILGRCEITRSRFHACAACWVGRFLMTLALDAVLALHRWGIT